MNGSTSEEGLSKVHFLDSIFAHTQWHWHTSSCNHSLVSHQLNFLSQIIFHFPEAAQKQGRNSPNPHQKRTSSSGLKKIQLPSQFGDETWKARPKCFYFKIYHLQLSSKFVCPHLSLTFLRWWRPLPSGGCSSHRNWLKLYFLPRPLLPDISCFISGLTKF